jgi:DNA-binding NarL/FixJ family response regulator
MSTTRLWVYSPSIVVNEALTAYLGSVGFATQGTADGAEAAVFDLTPFDSPLPPAPPTPCVAIVRAADPAIIHEVYALGYRGVQRPSDDAEHLARTIRAAVDGSTVATAGAPAREAVTSSDQPQLTARETQVLGLLMLGLPNKRIANRLGITERTIKHHVSSLMRKYQTRGRLGLLVKSQAASRS